MALSDLIIRQAKAANKKYTLPDTDGPGTANQTIDGGRRFRLTANQMSAYQDGLGRRWTRNDVEQVQRSNAGHVTKTDSITRDHQ